MSGANSSAEAPKYDYEAIEPGHYDAIYHERRGIRSKWHHLKFERLAAALGRFERHLDIGCGPGTFIGSLSGGGHSTGVDIAPAQIAYAQQRYSAPNREFRAIAPGPLPFPEGTFDLVTMVELVEHLEESESLALLGEARRVLRPGGRLILTTPNYAAFWPILEKLVNRFGTIDYADQHISQHQQASLRGLLERAGFHVETLETFLLSGPFFAALGWRTADWADRAEPAWIRRRLGHLLLAKATR